MRGVLVHVYLSASRWKQLGGNGIDYESNATIAKILTYFSNSNGSPVVLNVCPSIGGNFWAIENDTITAYNGTKCLEVVDGVNSNGLKLQISDCSPTNVNQKWDIGKYPRIILGYYIKSTSYDRCLKAIDVNFINGNKIQISTCSSYVETFNICLITDPRDPGQTPINARFHLPILCCERLTLGALLVWFLIQ